MAVLSDQIVCQKWRISANLPKHQYLPNDCQHPNGHQHTNGHKKMQI